MKIENWKLHNYLAESWQTCYSTSVLKWYWTCTPTLKKRWLALMGSLYAGTHTATHHCSHPASYMLLNLHLLQLGLSAGHFPSLISKDFHHTSVKIKFIKSLSKIVQILLLSDKNTQNVVVILIFFNRFFKLWIWSFTIGPNVKVQMIFYWVKWLSWHMGTLHIKYQHMCK